MTTEKTTVIYHMTRKELKLRVAELVQENENLHKLKAETDRLLQLANHDVQLLQRAVNGLTGDLVSKGLGGVAGDIMTGLRARGWFN